MNKILKLGLTLAAGAAAAHLVYHGYQNLADYLRRDLTDAVREHFSEQNIEAIWIFDDPDDYDAMFKGGVIVAGDKNISFEIDAESLEIIELSEEKI